MKLWDWLLAVALTVLLIGQAVAIAVSWGDGYWLTGVVSGAMVGGLAVQRRRQPCWFAAVGLVLAASSIMVAWAANWPSEPGPATALALAVLVGAAVRRVAVVRAAAVATGGAVVIVLSGLTGSMSSAVGTMNLVAWTAAVAGGLGLRVLGTRRRDNEAQVRRDERLVLARELHDVVAHHITGIVVQAQAAQLVGRDRPDRLTDSLDDIAVAGTDALAAMRRILRLLRDADDAAPSTPGPGRLSDLVDRFGASGRTVRLGLPDGYESESAWSPEVITTVYRVVQESLTNIARHAPHAAVITVDVARAGNGLTVEVTDDAPPAGVRRRPRAEGYGLIGMAERLEALGGGLSAGPRPAPAVGWQVRATLPEAAGARR